MDDRDELRDRLRAVAEHLDRASQPVDAASAMARPSPRACAHRWARLGIAATALVAAALVVVVQLGGDDRPLETIEPGPTSTSPPSSTTTTTSSATGEPIYEGMPVDQLPASGIAVTDGDAVVLLDYDGTVLGEVHSVLVTNGLGSGPGLSTLLVRPGPSFEIGGPESVEAAAGCDTPAGGGGLRVMLCGGAEQLRERVVTVDPLVVEDDLIEAAPGSQEMGHWRWALPSPDGRMVLAQWSGECEVPTAFFVPANGVEPRTVTGDEEVGGATESLGLGWAPDGRVAVQLLGGACGSVVDVPGVYLVDPASGERTLVRAAASDQTSVHPWRLEPLTGNSLEHTFARALRELGLDGCCGEPSHGGAEATTGVQWEGSDIPVFGRPVREPNFVPFNDLVISSEPIDLDGVPVTAGEADLGAFVSFTCGSNQWTVGGAGSGDRVEPGAAQAFAGELIAHLYCTVAERPQATGHGQL